MATIVQDIIAQSKVVYLGAFPGAQELPYIFDVEKNDLRRSEDSFGIRPLSASNAETITRNYTLDHGFELILTRSVPRGNQDDSQKIAALEVLYDRGDEFFKALVNTKINLPSVVLNVFDPEFSEPEFDEGGKIAILRMQYVVKYRSSLN